LNNINFGPEEVNNYDNIGYVDKNMSERENTNSTFANNIISKEKEKCIIF
jgi:hypothetical protein